jgi:hypothetical protein
MPSLTPIQKLSGPQHPRPGRIYLQRGWLAQEVPFSQSLIKQVFPPRYRGNQVFISWQSAGPPGTWFQVYVNGALSWAGRTTSVTLPLPTGPTRVDIGSVLAGQEWTSFADLLPAAPRRRATITWQGGRFLAGDLAGFHVYGSPGAGGPVSFAAPVATITAYPSGILTDGFGLGGFGGGGMGSVAGTYAWTSGPLSSGTWNFAVKSFDAAGNEGPAVNTSVAICVPPGEPPVFEGTQTRLNYAYSASSHQAALSWLASTP